MFEFLIIEISANISVIRSATGLRVAATGKPLTGKVIAIRSTAASGPQVMKVVRGAPRGAAAIMAQGPRGHFLRVLPAPRFTTSNQVNLLFLPKTFSYSSFCEFL